MYFFVQIRYLKSVFGGRHWKTDSLRFFIFSYRKRQYGGPVEDRGFRGEYILWEEIVKKKSVRILKHNSIFEATC